MISKAMVLVVAVMTMTVTMTMTMRYDESVRDIYDFEKTFEGPRTGGTNATMRCAGAAPCRMMPSSSYEPPLSAEVVPCSACNGCRKHCRFRAEDALLCCAHAPRRCGELEEGDTVIFRLTVTLFLHGMFLSSVGVTGE